MNGRCDSAQKNKPFSGPKHTPSVIVCYEFQTQELFLAEILDRGKRDEGILGYIRNSFLQANC